MQARDILFRRQRSEPKVTMSPLKGRLLLLMQEFTRDLPPMDAKQGIMVKGLLQSLPALLGSISDEVILQGINQAYVILGKLLDETLPATSEVQPTNADNGRIGEREDNPSTPDITPLPACIGD